jgi:hypothetical protein
MLPALIEATGPNWRPIKYSLFPPLGLATLAAYLTPDDEATILDATSSTPPDGRSSSRCGTSSSARDN